jgi:hypothetical protein
MQHLAYLMNPTGENHTQAGWPAPGYPPSHKRSPPQWPYMPHGSQSSHPPSTSISAYTTPTRPNPYLNPITPSLSHGTLPPSSPEELESPTKGISSMKGILGRSKSRGRRVSFKLDDQEERTKLQSHMKGKRKNGTPRVRSSSPLDRMGNRKAPEIEVEESDSDGTGVTGMMRGRPVRRAQTPGPPSLPASHLNGRKSVHRARSRG